MKKLNAIIAIMIAMVLTFSITFYSTDANASVKDSETKFFETIGEINLDIEEDVILANNGITAYKGLGEKEFKGLINSIRETVREVIKK